MSKSLCVIDESPALLPPPVLLFAGLVLLSCPVQKYTCFLFSLFIENKKLHIWPLLACVHALSLKSEISLAYCEFNTLFELARAADGNALPAKTPCGTGRKHSTKGKAAEVSRGGDTVRCVDSAKQHLQSQTRKINCGAAVLSCHDILKHSTGAKRRLWRLRPVSHGAYCRSTSASPPPLTRHFNKSAAVAGLPCTLVSSPMPLPPFPPPSVSSQVSVPALVLVDDVPAAAQLFPHVGHLLAKGSVLSLQEGRAHWDLVLLQSPGVPRALRRLVVFHSPAPVLLILSAAAVWYVGVCGEEGGGRREEEKKTKEEERVGWEGSVIWWGTGWQKWEKGTKGGNSWIVTDTE